MIARSHGTTSFAEAARILNRRPGTLREWLRHGLLPRRSAWGRAAPDGLTLDDLVSLEVVRRFVEAGVPLAWVRMLEAALRQMFPDTTRPFAHRIFFTNGASVWLDLAAGDRALLGLVAVANGAPAWMGTIGELAERLRHDDDGEVRSWDLG